MSLQWRAREQERGPKSIPRLKNDFRTLCRSPHLKTKIVRHRRVAQLQQPHLPRPETVRLPVAVEHPGDRAPPAASGDASPGAEPASSSPQNVAPDAPATRKLRLLGRRRFGLRPSRADTSPIYAAEAWTGRQFASLESEQGGNLRRAEGVVSPLAGAAAFLYGFTRKTGVLTLLIIRK